MQKTDEKVNWAKKLKTKSRVNIFCVVIFRSKAILILMCLFCKGVLKSFALSAQMTYERGRDDLKFIIDSDSVFVNNPVKNRAILRSTYLEMEEVL